MYIIDPDGGLREFKYVDKSYYENLTGTQRQAGRGLPPTTEFDGSSC